MPNLIRCGGISALPARELYTQLSMNRMVAAHWYKAFSHVSSVAKKTVSGEAFAIKFGKLNLIQDQEELSFYKEMSAGLVHSQVGIPNMPTPEEIEATAATEIPEKAESTTEEEKPVEEKPAEKPVEEPPKAEEKPKPPAAPAAPKTSNKKETNKETKETEPPPEVPPEAEAEIDLNF